MNPKKILFITQEICPYLPETPQAETCRNLPQLIQEKGHEIRTFMPKYGSINERRNQLHEVIRLSGMNLIIDDTDHSLIIKVASIQAARMQVYFIDNEDFFQNRETTVDKDGVEYEDNDERSIFFVRGVMETIKKLRWVPDVIHCHGWMSALAPIFIKKGYADDPNFKNTKVIYSTYDDSFENPFRENFADKLKFEGIDDGVIERIKERGSMDYTNLTKLAIEYSDGVIQGGDSIPAEITDFIKEQGLELLAKDEDFDTYVENINEFYNKIDAE
ncbi:MAG: glycogen/starch synthase [Bacteroidales bacterium]|jgi:starch synthase|nr:glycogen/starch synthase [Bacteroidales bacterium]